MIHSSRCGLGTLSLVQTGSEDLIPMYFTSYLRALPDTYVHYLCALSCTVITEVGIPAAQGKSSTYCKVP